jgi:hypothetical protein
MMAGRSNPVQKQANLIKQKYIKPETAARNIKNQIKFSIDNEKIEELKSKPMQENFCQDIERPSVDKERLKTIRMQEWPLFPQCSHCSKQLNSLHHSHVKGWRIYQLCVGFKLIHFHVNRYEKFMVFLWFVW